MTSPILPIEDPFTPIPPTPRWRRVAASYWTPAAIDALILPVHWWWFARCRVMPRAEVVSGFGAAVVVLGILVAARPYLRAGVRGLARAQIPPPQFPGYADDGGRMITEALAFDQARVEAAMPDVRAERVVAVAIILAGTLTNGYGGAIARILATIFGLRECT